MEAKKISKKTLMKSFHHWFYGNLTCFFTRTYTDFWLYLTSMLPIVEELCDQKKIKEKAMHTYTAFFNTEPQLGSLIVGITAYGPTIRKALMRKQSSSLRAGLMGPIAGIGDSLVVGTLIPVILGIALGLSNGGSPVGAIFYIVVWKSSCVFLEYVLHILKAMNLATKQLNS